MKLKGKARTDFMLWYWQYQDMNKLSLVQFDNMPDNVKYGVFVDFFDTIGLSIELFMTPDHQLKWTYSFSHSELCKTEFNTRQEARASAIEKANEIYNNR